MLVGFFMRKSGTSRSLLLSSFGVEGEFAFKILLHPSKWNKKKLQSLAWWVENCLHYNIFDGLSGPSWENVFFFDKTGKRSRPEHADSIERDFYWVSGLKKGDGKVRGEKAVIDKEV